MKQKDLLFILLSSFLLIVAWVVFSIVHNATASKITSTQELQIAPIVPDFDSKTINNLKAKNQVTPAYSPLQPTPTPTPALTPILPIQQQASIGGKSQ